MDEQTVNQQTGVKDVPAAEGQSQFQDNQQQSQQPENQNAGQSQQQQQAPESIPYERFTEVNNKVKELEQQVQMSQQQLALYQANMQNPQDQQQQQKQLPDFYEGLEEDDVMTVAEAKKATQAMVQQFSSAINEVQFLVQHPDYNEIVGSPQKLGEPLKQAILKNPQIMTEIRHSPNPMLTAYNYAKMAQSGLSDNQQQPNPAFQNGQAQQLNTGNQQQPQVNPAAAAAINSATRPGSASMAGTNGGFNAANRFATMSDEEFAAYEAKILSQG